MPCKAFTSFKHGDSNLQTLSNCVNFYLPSTSHSGKSSNTILPVKMHCFTISRTLHVEQYTCSWHRSAHLARLLTTRASQTLPPCPVHTPPTHDTAYTPSHPPPPRWCLRQRLRSRGSSRGCAQPWRCRRRTSVSRLGAWSRARECRWGCWKGWRGLPVFPLGRRSRY